MTDSHNDRNANDRNAPEHEHGGLHNRHLGRARLLEGIRVLDLSALIAGLLAGVI